MKSHTKIFARRVEDYMHALKVLVPLGTTCEDVLNHMVDKKAPCCVIHDSHGKLAGILRTEDILERVVFKVGPQTLVEDVMENTVQTVAPQEYLYHAIGRMRRYGVSEIVVVNPAMQPLGIIYQKEAVEVAADHLLQQIDRLSGDGDLISLRGVKEAQIEIAHDMFLDKMDATLTQQLLTHVNNDIMARVVKDNLAHMKAEGWGDVPVTFCVIVMGSAGRGENFLYPDQDNGFILEDYPDEDHTHIDSFFRELAQRMCDDLHEVGLPYCSGNVMATNPLWRKSLSQWREQVLLWGRKRNSVALRLADIFFDFKPVCGEISLGEELRHSMLKAVRENHFFLSEMYRQQSEHSVALGVFGKFSADRLEGESQKGVDLKYRGTLPLVEGVRLLALKQGLHETNTMARIEKLHLGGVLSDGEADYLRTAFSFLTHLLLKRQVEEYESHQPVERFITLESLSELEKDNLHSAFRHIEAFRKRLKSEFTGDVF